MKHGNIAIFVPHNGCTHACSFCSQSAITGASAQPTAEDVTSAVTTALASNEGENKVFEIAFFGGSFTAIKPDYMESLLSASYPFVRDALVSGIRVSTRPDCITPSILKMLKQYGVTAIELGAQSMVPEVLEKNQRGHTPEQVVAASRLILEHGFLLGLQMMTGLYTDTVAGAWHTARALSKLNPSTIRIYPTVVLADTMLAVRYQKEEFYPMTLSETVTLCADLLTFFEEKQIPVIRLGLHSTPELEANRVAGGFHPALRELCESKRFYDKVTAEMAKSPKMVQITLGIHPKNRSIATGQKKSNVIAWQNAGKIVTIIEDDALQNRQDFYLK